MNSKRNINVKKILIVALFFFIGIISLFCLVLQIGYAVSQKNTTIKKPDYVMSDISGYLDKTELSESEYNFLYMQTGLTKIGIDRALAHGKEGKEKILDIQKDFFGKQTISPDPFAPWVCTDYIKENVTPVYLEDGDIIVTASTLFHVCE